MKSKKEAYELGRIFAAIDCGLIKESQVPTFGHIKGEPDVKGGLLGYLLGTTGGGLSGRLLGGKLGKIFGLNKVNPKLIGMGVGGLLGGSAGAYLGARPKEYDLSTVYPSETSDAIQNALVQRGMPMESESALGAPPIAYSDYDPYADYGYDYNSY